MNIISWNCRGLGGPTTVPSLKYLVCVYKPDVLFLCETLSNSNKIEEFRYVLGFDYCFTVNREGKGGGLALFWNSAFNCSISNYSQNHIDIEVVDASTGNWRLTCYYGFPGSGQRRAAWNFLKNLSQSFNLP
jgi:exonuclease III